MKRSVAKPQLSLGVFFGLALLVANNVVGCGSSSSDSPDNGTTDNSAGSTGQGANGVGGTTSGTPTEGTPNNIALDPNRDPTLPVNLTASGAVQCGAAGNYCIKPNLTCCTVGGGMGMANTFSCEASAAACPAGTTSSAACSSKASCGSTEVCCRTAGGGGMMAAAASATCEASCAVGSVQLCLTNAECGAGNQCNNNGTCGPIPCTAGSCSGGQICCRGAGGGGGGAAAAAACAAPVGDGLCPNNQRRVCADAATDCPAGNTCVALGGGGGGGLVCTPPPCTTTSCTGGQLCCVGGGAPACANPNAGVCPGNARLLCVTDADCTSVAGTQCLAGGGGGNAQLACRLPPAPPADAGVVGDAG